jgi:hypothetical protein
MATLAELWTLMESAPLKEKVSSACLIAAEAIRVEDSGTANHANRIKWAKAVLKDHVQAGDDMLKAVLAANSAAALATITAASDATIQSAVNAAVNIFADGT